MHHFTLEKLLKHVWCKFCLKMLNLILSWKTQIQHDSNSHSDPDYSLAINSENGATVTGLNVIGTLMNGTLVKTSSDHKYIELDGIDDYVDLGDNKDNCLGNLIHCPDGLTLSMWLKPTKLQNGRQWYQRVTNLFVRYFVEEIREDILLWERLNSEF